VRKGCITTHSKFDGEKRYSDREPKEVQRYLTLMLFLLCCVHLDADRYFGDSSLSSIRASKPTVFSTLLLDAF